MNLGFSGPIVAKGLVVLNERVLRLLFGHLRRTREPIEVLGIDGGIVEMFCD